MTALQGLMEAQERGVQGSAGIGRGFLGGVPPSWQQQLVGDVEVWQDDCPAGLRKYRKAQCRVQQGSCSRVWLNATGVLVTSKTSGRMQAFLSAGSPGIHTPGPACAVTENNM
jgi:hypothetical protein